MAAHAIALHGALPYACRILVTQRRHAALAALAAEHGFLVAYNDAPERGIASSIRAGLALLAAQDAQPRGLLFGVCDQPYLMRGTLLRLLDSFDRAPERIVAPCHAGRRGNPVIFPARFLPELGALSGRSARLCRHPRAPGGAAARAGGGWARTGRYRYAPGQ